MIRLVVTFLVNLGLTLQCLDLNMMWWQVMSDGVKHMSLWTPWWRFLWCWSIYWRPWQLADIIFLFSMDFLCL